MLVIATMGPAGVAQAQIAPSQVTPRSLRPEPPPMSTPIQLPRSLPSEAPAGAADLPITVGEILAEGSYPEMAEETRAIFAPLVGRPITVGDLYRAAAAVESAYSRRGYFLARVVVSEQRVAAGETFRVVIVDGFIESLDDGALPRRIRTPIHGVMRGIVGKRRPMLADLQRRLALAGAVPGARLRSTLAKGERPGGARLILDGGYKPFGLTIGADNRLGPAFNNWGVNLQATINSPTGHGEQLYAFLSGQPRLDETFRRDSLRRVAGGGLTLPLTSWGLTINPEFTYSNTNPRVSNPLLASNGRLYRGTVNLIAPLLSTAVGSLTARLGLEVTDERQTLPAFDFTLSKDRLTVLRANLAWRGQFGAGGSIVAETTLSQGIDALGARTASSIAASNAPSSRGSDPQFTRAELRLTTQQRLIEGAVLTVIGRAQTSFGTVVPNSETFDLTGLDGLSTFTAGLLSADGGVMLRSELGRTLTLPAGAARLFATPYLFAAVGRSHFVVRDALNPNVATSYGLGLRLAAQGLPLGAAPAASIEYGHGDQNRGGASDDRVSVSLGVQF